MHLSLHKKLIHSKSSHNQPLNNLFLDVAFFSFKGIQLKQVAYGFGRQLLQSDMPIYSIYSFK